MKLSLQQKKEAYLLKIRELGRNIQGNEVYYFSDGSNMRNWYYENIKILKNNKNQRDEKLLEKVRVFADIDNVLYDLKKEKNKLNFEQRAKEYLLQIKKLKRNVLYKEHYTFSDGTDMWAWYYNNMASLKRKETLDIKKIYLLAMIDYELYEMGVESVAKKNLPFKNKVAEYLKKIQSLGRNIKPSDQAYFSDGTSMENWFHDKYFNGVQKEEDRLLFEELLSVIPKNLTFEEKCEEYFIKAKEVGKIITGKDSICFSDQSNMGSWFERYMKRMDEPLEEKSSCEKQIEKMKRLKELCKKLENIGIYYSKVKKISFEAKVEEFKQKVVEIKRKIRKEDTFYFSDGVHMGQWYFKVRSNFYQIKKRGENYSQEQLNCLMMFATIEDLYYDLLKNKKKVYKG